MPWMLPAGMPIGFSQFLDSCVQRDPPWVWQAYTTLWQAPGASACGLG
jgi:hypothetical protein